MYEVVVGEKIVCNIVGESDSPAGCLVHALVFCREMIGFSRSFGGILAQSY